MSKIMYTEVIRTTNLAMYKEKEREFIELDDRSKSMLSTYIRKVTFRNEDQNSAIDYSIVFEDMEDIYLERKEKDLNIVTKEFFPLSREQVDAILSGDYSVIEQSEEPGLRSFYELLVTNQLTPAFRKEFTRKLFHQNKFLDIVFDISMNRKPYEKNDLFAPKGVFFNTDYSNLRMSIRQNLSFSKPMEQLLAFEKEFYAQNS